MTDDSQQPLPSSVEAIAEIQDSKAAIRRLFKKLAIGLTVLLAFAAACSILLKEQLEQAGSWFIGTLGLKGLFLGTIITDSSPLPLTNEPLMALALTGGAHWSEVLVITSCASVTAGFVGYSLGRALNTRLRVIERFSQSHPDMIAWLKKHGAKGVAVAAFLPIPYSIATWSAGAMNIGLRKVMLASLVRIPKTILYLTLIKLGLQGV